MGKAIQLRGTPAILKAFDSIAIANWALVYDRQILFKCAGEQLEESKSVLEGFIKQLEKSRTSAQYVLHFYEDIKDRKKIRISTESDFAYNIEIFDAEEYPEPNSVRRRDGYALITDRLDAIDAKLALKDEEETDEEDTIGATPGWLGAVNKILDNPAVQKGLGDRLMQMLDSFLKPTQAPAMPKQLGTIGGTGQEASDAITQITQEQYDKIQTSVQILAGIDPQLGDHLEKIAQLAQINPKKYKSMIGMLQTFL